MKDGEAKDGEAKDGETKAVPRQPENSFWRQVRGDRSDATGLTCRTSETLCS